MILDQRFLESTSPDKWLLRTFRQDSCCSFSGFSRCVARIFPEVRPTFSTSAMMLVFQASCSQISCDFFSPHRPTHPKPGNLFDAKRTKRGWPKPYGFFLGLLTTLLLRISLYLSFALFCSYFVGKIIWNCNCTKTFYIPIGDSRTRIKKMKKKWWFIDRKGYGVGLGLVTALLFTRALSNGPEIQKEKWLWTDYLRLDIKQLLRWDLSLFMELIQSDDVNFVMPSMLPGHVS